MAKPTKECLEAIAETLSEATNACWGEVIDEAKAAIAEAREADDADQSVLTDIENTLEGANYDNWSEVVSAAQRRIREVLV